MAAEWRDGTMVALLPPGRASPAHDPWSARVPSGPPVVPFPSVECGPRVGSSAWAWAACDPWVASAPCAAGQSADFAPKSGCDPSSVGPAQSAVHVQSLPPALTVVAVLLKCLVPEQLTVGLVPSAEADLVPFAEAVLAPPSVADLVPPAEAGLVQFEEVGPVYSAEAGPVPSAEAGPAPSAEAGPCPIC